MYADAIASARKAIGLAPDLAIGHWALGNALFYGTLDPKGARGPYDKSYALARGDADVGIAFAHFCVRTGRTTDAKAATDRALTLDPLNARAHRAAGLVAAVGGDAQKALTLYQHALELNSKLAFVRSLIGNTLYKLGRLDDAYAAFAAETNQMFQLTGLAIVEHKRGRDAAAERAFQQIIAAFGDNALYQQAQILAQWGRPDAALAALGKARAVGDAGLTFMLIDPMLDPLRADPEFSELLKQIGFA